jgi:hypothetical protein
MSQTMVENPSPVWNSRLVAKIDLVFSESGGDKEAGSFCY